MAKRPPPIWFDRLVAEVFARGARVSMDDVAKTMGKTVEACEAALKTEYCRAQAAQYSTAVRKHLVSQRMAPMQELQQWGHEAARGLVAAMWMAAERENIRELRESSSAVLNYLGHSPVKRTDKTVTHKVDAINDPAILAEIIRSGELPDDMLSIEGPR